jgi:lysine-N-methylase
LASESYLEIIRSEVKPAHIYSDDFVTQVYPQQSPADEPLHYYFELEQHFIDILQWRSLPMTERLNRICDTVHILCSSKIDDMGREITRIIYHNYEQLEVDGAYPLKSDASDILVENYFVNTIFKKLLYDQGLIRGAAILQLLWRHIEQVSKQETNENSRWERVRAAILELEFEYSHHRSRFKNRQLET